MAEALSQHGLSQPKVESFSDAECERYFQGFYYGSNCRALASRARKTLGWSPKKGTADFYNELPKLVEELIKSGKV